MLAPVTAQAPDGTWFVLAALADGVGGAPFGERASAEALAALRGAFADLAASRSDDPPALLAALVGVANRAVHDAAQASVRRGMATTLVAALFARGRLWVANVGDSRAYLLRDGRSRLLTEDHVADGRLTQALGHGEPVPRLAGPLHARRSDVIALTSDGVHGFVRTSELADAVRSRPLERAARLLAYLARRRGSGDDTSTVLLRGC
jgi:protein phosphatase